MALYPLGTLMFVCSLQTALSLTATNWQGCTTYCRCMSRYLVEKWFPQEYPSVARHPVVIQNICRWFGLEWPIKSHWPHKRPAPPFAGMDWPAFLLPAFFGLSLLEGLLRGLLWCVHAFPNSLLRCHASWKTDIWGEMGEDSIQMVSSLGQYRHMGLKQKKINGTRLMILQYGSRTSWLI